MYELESSWSVWRNNILRNSFTASKWILFVNWQRQFRFGIPLNRYYDLRRISQRYSNLSSFQGATEASKSCSIKVSSKVRSRKKNGAFARKHQTKHFFVILFWTEIQSHNSHYPITKIGTRYSYIRFEWEREREKKTK